jgi:hypothetical protein
VANFDPNDHLMKLSGKDYLPVAWRLVWFRDRFPEGHIKTEVIELTDQRAVFRADVTAIVGGEIMGGATSHGSETPKDFRDYIEKAETKAIGRALAALGLGTQFAPELEEGERIVDSPVERKPVQPGRPVQTPSGDTRFVHRLEPPPPVHIDRETGEITEATPSPKAEAKPTNGKNPKRIALYALMSDRGLTDDDRHLLGWALLGKSSSKEWTDPEVERMHRWVGRHDREMWQKVLGYLRRMDEAAKKNSDDEMHQIATDIGRWGIDDPELIQCGRNYRTIVRKPATA